MRWSGVALGVVSLLGLSVGPAQAAWQDELRQQILSDHACEVSFLSQVVDRTVDGRRIIMAKVHCEDRRTFDAYRGDSRERFEIKACEKPEAEAC